MKNLQNETGEQIWGLFWYHVANSLLEQVHRKIDGHPCWKLYIYLEHQLWDQLSENLNEKFN